MTHKSLSTGLICLLLILLAACNLPQVGGTPENVDASIETSVAETLQAAKTLRAIPTTAAPQASATPSPTGAPAGSPAGAATPSPLAQPLRQPPPQPGPQRSQRRPLLPSPPTSAATLVPGDIYSYNILSGGDFMLVVQFEQPLSGQYTALLDGKDFLCQILPQYPNRLYCHGPNPRPGSMVDISIHSLEQNSLVFARSWQIPYIYTPTPVRPTPTPWGQRPKRTKTPKP